MQFPIETKATCDVLPDPGRVIDFRYNADVGRHLSDAL
jgi:hypothetical protein